MSYLSFVTILGRHSGSQFELHTHFCVQVMNINRNKNCNSVKFRSHFTLGLELFQALPCGLKRRQVFKNGQLKVQNSGKKRGEPRGALKVLHSYTFLLYLVKFLRTLDALIMRKRSLLVEGLDNGNR